MAPEEKPDQTLPCERDGGTPTQPEKGGSSARWAGGIALALVLYVLSTGPAMKLHKAGYLPDEMRIVYAPLGWVLEAADPDEKYLWPAFDWYLETVWGENS